MNQKNVKMENIVVVLRNNKNGSMQTMSLERYKQIEGEIKKKRVWEKENFEEFKNEVSEQKQKKVKVLKSESEKTKQIDQEIIPEENIE